MAKDNTTAENKPEEGLLKKATERRGHRLVRCVLFAFLGLWAVIVVLLQVILSPAVLTKIADGFANDYVDGTVRFSGIKASMFRSFPNLNVTIDDFSITYPHERFAVADTLTTLDGPLQKLGRGATADTLVHFDRLSAGVNYLSAIFGKLRIRRAVLEHPRIFARQYSPTLGNWNIFRLQEDDGQDTSDFRFPSVSIGRITLTGRPIAVYSNPCDTVFGSIFIKQVDASGHYKAGRGELESISLNIDSLFLAGRLPSDTLALALDRLKIKERGERFDLELESKVLLALRSAGRMSIPVTAKGKIVPNIKEKVISVKKADISVATVDIAAEGKMDWSKDSTFILAHASIDKEPVREITEFFGDNFPILKELQTDALLSMEANCEGYLVSGKSRIPPLSIRLMVPESSLGWKSLNEYGSFALDATATSADGMLSADVPDLNLRINGLGIELKGDAQDLLGDDPVLNVDSDIHAVLDSLSRFLPDSLDIAAEGRLDGFIKGGVRISQFSLYNFSDSGLEGNLKSDGIRILCPKDTIAAFLGKTSITLGKLQDSHNQGKTGISASIDSVFAEYGSSTYFGGTGIRISASNPTDLISGEEERHPVEGSLDISSIGMMDLDSCFVGLRGSASSFKISRTSKEGRSIPYLSLSSRNKGIAVRQGVNRITIEDAVLSAAAHPNTFEAKARRQHYLDSLQRVYPGVQRDSLFRKAFSKFLNGPLPDFLSEKDFAKKDIDIRLSESMAKYVKDWDISGKLQIGEGAVITPYYPLDNKLSGLSCDFTNDWVKLSSVTLSSGVSDISAKGTLSGLKRALTGKGRLNLDLGLSSELIDANEILQAINAGRNFVPPEHNAALSQIDDKDYLSSVQDKTVADTADISSLIVLPANLNAKVSLQASTIRYSNLETSWVSSDLEMKERCLQAMNTLAMTNMGDVFLEGFYSTRTKKDLKAGFDLMLSNITAEKVIQLFPAVDSIMPMLQSFKGLMDCELAATASIDTAMNILLPSLNGILKIDGKNLTLADSDEMNKLRRTLMFRDKDSSYIERMSVRGIIKDNHLEIFPFILNVDRYSVAASGLQNFDQNFKYHLSALKSPIPFRFGINFKGSFEDWKWKLAKAKYKSRTVPVFDDQVDGLRFNLINAIHNIFDRGVDQALEQNEKSQEAIEDKKAELDYSAEAQADTLSAVEKRTLETMEKVANGQIGQSGKQKTE